ncbi:hypothetical protein J4G33_10115 [Actinotalea sp. BY-33]|uniref:Uncharacterized protein n=1 Tax=Actinotalea soli TaxID=2819234 RepID=A0A939LQI7_9CELL|nr:hypothetical protein [Actinotalea soli]MBO1752158.1 hypothetical protein [Actinotalea soli]
MDSQIAAGLHINWEWQAAPNVRAPELAATWSRLTITVDDVIATLVEERGASHGVRKSLDVPTYPLAEWLALNWWNLNTMAHRPADNGVELSRAGDGFAWPEMTLRTDLGTVWIDIRRRDRDPDFVRFLSEGRAVLETQDVTSEIARFIDATARRLEDQSITGTLLQQEWAAIQGAEPDEVEFCTVAAAWGLDPYNTPPDDTQVLIAAVDALGNSALVAQLARAVELSDIRATESWLFDASRRIRMGVRVPHSRESQMSRLAYSRPWLDGYEHAAALRRALAPEPSRPVSIEDFVGITAVAGQAPAMLAGLVAVGNDSAGVVLPQVGPTATRFAAARALGRMMTSRSDGLSVMTHSGRYLEKVERAFAAEFLAPAAGISEMAAGDYSEAAVKRIAKRFQVNPVVIQHQIDNQILAA